MDELRKEIAAYKDKNSLSIEDLAKKLSITTEQLKHIIEGKIELETKEIDRIKDIIHIKKNSSRKAIKILDLIFRFCATLMALVVVILCIYDYNNSNTLITLLAIGLACLSMTTLPKIDK